MTKTLRELALAATPGPWHSPGMGEVHMPSHDSVAQICFRHEFADDDEMFGTQDDAAYIVAACNAVPALLDTIDEQQRTIAALMVGAPDDTTTPVIRRIAELENTIDELRSALDAASPADCGEAGHSEGRCGNARCSRGAARFSDVVSDGGLDPRNASRPTAPDSKDQRIAELEAKVASLRGQEPVGWFIDVTTNGQSTGDYQLAAKEHWGDRSTCVPLYLAAGAKP